MQISITDHEHWQRKEEDFDYSKLKDLGTVTIYQNLTQDEIIEKLADAEVIIVGKTLITKNTIDSLKNLKLICKAGTGYDKIDINAAKKRNLPVVNFPNYSSYMVAQWTLTLLLTLVSSTLDYCKSVKANLWKESQFRYPIHQLQGKTLGLVGFGNIAKKFLHFIKPFDLNILVHTNYPDTSIDVNYVDLHTLAKESDFISLHKPYKR